MIKKTRPLNRWLLIYGIITFSFIISIPLHARIEKLPQYPQKGSLSMEDIYKSRPDAGKRISSVNQGDTFIDLLRKQGISTADALKASKNIDRNTLRRIKPGGEIDFIFNKERTLIVEIGYSFSDQRRKVLYSGAGLIVKGSATKEYKPVKQTSYGDCPEKESVLKSFNPQPVEEQAYYSSAGNKITVRIKKGHNLYTILRKLGIHPGEIDKISRAIEPVYSLKSLKPGKQIVVWVNPENRKKIERIEFESANKKMLSLSSNQGKYSASIRNKPAVLAVTEHGNQQKIMKTPAMIIAGDMEYIPGMVPWEISDESYGPLYDDSKSVYKSSIFNAPSSVKARFRNEMYKEKQRLLKAKLAARKEFLKAPLDYRKITSKFAWRINPITGNREHHTGVDYAAPVGTPVKAIGYGKVVFTGWRSGYGKTIQIKHQDGYLSQYAHLSRYAKGITDGKQVKRGQVIGYVGSSGMSTGPHLDLRVMKSGVFINPLTLNKTLKKKTAKTIKKSSRSLASSKKVKKKAIASNR